MRKCSQGEVRVMRRESAGQRYHVEPRQSDVEPCQTTPNDASTCQRTPPTQQRPALPTHRGLPVIRNEQGKSSRGICPAGMVGDVLATVPLNSPEGAGECSHGWSPDWSGRNPWNDSMSQSPRRGGRTGRRSTRPPLPGRGVLIRLDSHGFRPTVSDSTRGYTRPPLRGEGSFPTR
jgi:hypothetical protein